MWICWQQFSCTYISIFSWKTYYSCEEQQNRWRWNQGNVYRIISHRNSGIQSYMKYIICKIINLHYFLIGLNDWQWSFRPPIIPRMQLSNGKWYCSKLGRYGGKSNLSIVLHNQIEMNFTELFKNLGLIGNHLSILAYLGSYIWSRKT